MFDLFYGFKVYVKYKIMRFNVWNVSNVKINIDVN